MIERLNAIEIKYQKINEQLMDSSIVKDFNKIKKLSKEKSSLEEIVEVYQQYKKNNKTIEETKQLICDKELGLLAKEELESLKEEKEKLEKKLKLLLLPKDENEGKNVIVEIRGAAGGDEANIFAGDLYQMYIKYAFNMGWKYEIINSVSSVSGGYTQIEFIIKGQDAYSKLKYESGSHRVQRVPVTETQGRIHTSTATVIVMPEQENLDIDIKESDLKIDVYKSSGAGGQSVNTTDSAVRMTHLPTGIVVTCQNERSQLKNKEKALNILKSKIYEEETRKKEAEIGTERRLKIGTGDRSEKIRTYNYPQNRITDHRINLTIMHLDKVMDGNLGEVIEPLINEETKRKLAGE